MSFLHSMHEYVTSGISSLGLGPRRFSLSRQESGEQERNTVAGAGGVLQPSAGIGNNILLPVHASTSSGGVGIGGGGSSSGYFSSTSSSFMLPSSSSASGSSTNYPGGGVVIGNPNASNPLLGYPKANTPASSSSANSTPLASRRQSRALDGLAPPRTGSFRQRTSSTNLQQETQPRPTLAFVKRRLSWPEVNPCSNSGVQETDNSYFESFTSLGWKRENRRMSATHTAESRAEITPEKERSTPEGEKAQVPERPEDKEQLYVDVLRAINSIAGPPAQGAQISLFKDEMYLHAQRTFGISQERHYRLMQSAAEDRRRITVLSVVVVEADGLEAKDANGFSDPYCMLGIQPEGGPPISPLPLPPTPRALSADMSGVPGFDGGAACSSGGVASNDSQPHRKHSFRLSFKRRDGSRREQRDSLGGPVPAKFIKATTTKPHTLCPKWNEKFKFDLDDVMTDRFHLDIWDHDDESSVMDAVSRLNEVRTVRGFSRFFKQICQSARQGSQDDFLGSVNISLCDIPSSGMDAWFKLEARSHRSTVQGRIRLKLWLSSRSDQCSIEEDHEVEVKKLERIHMAFMQHEVATHEPSWTWTGDLSTAALTIMQQMAILSDLSDLDFAMARFVAAAKLNTTTALDPKAMHRLLAEMEKQWNQPNQDALSHELEQWLAEAMNGFVERSLSQIRRHRDIFPALHSPSLIRLEFLLRCLGMLATMRAFRSVCPFNKGVRGEVVNALRKGSIAWSQCVLRSVQSTTNPLTAFVTTLSADIQLGYSYYHSLFDNTSSIQYYSIVYKQFDAIIGEEVYTRMTANKVPGVRMTLAGYTAGDGEPEVVDAQPFELFLALQEFVQLKRHLSAQPQPPEKPLALANCHNWFIVVFERWMMVSKSKAIQRIRAAVSRDVLCNGDRVVRYSSSAIDVSSILTNIKEFWKVIAWPEPMSGMLLESQLIDVACSTAIYYADLIHTALVESGYYEAQGPFKCSDEMCVTVNNLEYVRRNLSDFRSDGDPLENAADNLLESTLTIIEQRCERVLGKLGPMMQSSLQKTVFHLAWSPESLPAVQALQSLLEYLDNHLSALNSALLSKNFSRSLKFVWLTVLSEIGHQMETGDEIDKPSSFYRRLHEALKLLVEFFNAEGQGLSIEMLHCAEYWHLDQRLQFNKRDTNNLIDLFYMNRLEDQQIAPLPGPYGSLTVRAYFNHDSLCVEVLHGRDIVPLDPNGFSDPFVIIELLPRRTFQHCTEQQTNVHKKTLNPIFDECFEFPVTLEQCLTDGAMICFTVMDHDVLTANDFGGEAYLALNNIPGVDDYSTSVENFHGLKHIELALMQQLDKNIPILQILEKRTMDRVAQDFVKKQKSRYIS